MATPPDFSVGQVLTAAHMDAVGLWLIKTETVGTSVGSVPVADVFSADFQNYLIIMSGGVSVAPSALSLQLGASTTGYYFGAVGTAYGSNTLAYLRDNNSASWTYAGGVYPDGMNMTVSVFRPFDAVKTGMICHERPDYRTTGGSTGGSGFHDVAASYTGFTVISASNMTGGTIRVYGYRD